MTKPFRTGIAVFSGTGNTAHVAGLLAKNLAAKGAQVEIKNINSKMFVPGNSPYVDFAPESYDIAGIGHPVLGFGPTPLVLRFAEAIPEGKGRMFVFKSAADNHVINNSASEDLIEILKSKGYDVFHDFLYVMPCNWIFKYELRFSLQLLDEAEIKAARHADELTAGVRSEMPVFSGWRAVARFFHFLESNYGRKLFGRALLATQKCSLCGTCIKNCPAGNIRKENDKIVFDEDCLFCMRCVYGCPESAITAPGFNWCIVKGGYRLSDYVGAVDADRTFITENSRGYWRHFYDYFR